MKNNYHALTRSDAPADQKLLIFLYPLYGRNEVSATSILTNLTLHFDTGCTRSSVRRAINNKINLKIILQNPNMPKSFVIVDVLSYYLNIDWKTMSTSDSDVVEETGRRAISRLPKKLFFP